MHSVSDITGCDDGDVRLTGKNDTTGTVEVCHDSGWHWVCDDYWSKEEAKVVCRQLGLSPNSELRAGLYRDGGGLQDILLHPLAYFPPILEL